MATNLTSIQMIQGEPERAKAQLKQVLTQLWSDKVEEHYVALHSGGNEYWLKINAKQPQILYCASDHRTALIPFVKSALDEFFAGKIPAGQSYFHDIDHDQRIENSKTGNFVYPGGTPQERLEKEPAKEFTVKQQPVPPAKDKPSLIGFFKRKTPLKEETPGIKPKLGGSDSES